MQITKGSDEELAVFPINAGWESTNLFDLCPLDVLSHSDFFVFNYRKLFQVSHILVWGCSEMPCALLLNVSDQV